MKESDAPAVNVKKLLSTPTSVLIAIGVAAILFYAAWFTWGQAPYGARCSSSLRCRTFYCLKHDLAGSDQRVAPGTCTQECDKDADCGSGAKCVELSPAAADDLPSIGRPDRACMRVR